MPAGMIAVCLSVCPGSQMTGRPLISDVILNLSAEGYGHQSLHFRIQTAVNVEQHETY